MNEEERKKSLESYVEQYQENEDHIKQLKSSNEILKESILGLLSDDIEGQLKDSEYGCGTASLLAGNYQVNVTYSKKVEWDNNGLSELANKIKEAGDDPLKYLKVEYSVYERDYKKWGETIKTQFDKHRIVKRGKPTIKIN